MTQKYLTTEKLRTRYPNHFRLVSHAIHEVTDFIHSHRTPRINVESENPANIILEEMLDGIDVSDKAHRGALEKLQKETATGALTEDR